MARAVGTILDGDIILVSAVRREFPTHLARMSITFLRLDRKSEAGYISLNHLRA
jgi:hypothetical protein